MELTQIEKDYILCSFTTKDCEGCSLDKEHLCNDDGYYSIEQSIIKKMKSS